MEVEGGIRELNLKFISCVLRGFCYSNQMHKTTFYTVARLQNIMTEFRIAASYLPPEIYSHLELAVDDVNSELCGLSQSFLDHVANSER
jgi:hypothetical protein